MEQKTEKIKAALETLFQEQHDYTDGPGADTHYNDLNRQAVALFSKLYGQAFLGSLTIPDRDRRFGIITGVESVYTLYTEDVLIPDKSYTFCIPVQDDELERLIRLGYPTSTQERLSLYRQMRERITAVGGFPIIWM